MEINVNRRSIVSAKNSIDQIFVVPANFCFDRDHDLLHSESDSFHSTSKEVLTIGSIISKVPEYAWLCRENAQD